MLPYGRVTAKERRTENHAEGGKVGPNPARIILQFESPGSPKETNWD